MKIHSLMFGWEYPPMSLGGLGVACKGLVDGLLSNNVQVSLVLPHNNAAKGQDIDIVHPTEDEIRTIKEIVKVDSILQPYDSAEQFTERVEQYLHSEPKQLKDIYGKDLHQAIHYFTEMSVDMTKHIDADVVHCHDWMTYEAGHNAAKHHDIPLVAHIHATELDRTHFSPNDWIYNKELRGFTHADTIIAVSGYTKQILIDHYKIDPYKIEVVHNGTSDKYCANTLRIKSEHVKTKKKKMILFLGRLALQKGANQFLEMAAQIHKTDPEVTFVMAGSGHMFNELVDRSIELGLQNNVIFAGKVDDREARRLYHEADCFVMPSLSEPFGLVALEAIAHGTPVILSKQSGAAEVVGHCFTVDFWNTGMMADCALTVLRDNHLAEQLRSEAPHILKDLTWKNQAAKVKSIYGSSV